MKQMIKNILVIVTLLLVSLGTVAGVDISVIYKLDGIKITNSADIPGSVSYRNGEITITPKSGYYFSLDDPDDLIVIKTIDGSQAQTRTPNINTGLEITAKDATADPSGETKYTFTVPGDEYDYEITANFHKRTSITKNYNISIEKGPGTDGHYIYTGATFEPTVTLALGNTTLTENTDFTVTYADNIDAGTGKITLEGIRKYDGKLTGKGNNGLSALTFVIDKADPTLKFTPGSATITFGKESEFEMPTLKTAPEGITVTYESKDPNTATVHKSTGDITPVAFGKTTITAKYDGDDNWNSASDSYTLTVEKGKAVVKKAPTANSQTYTYTGEPQELIVAGEGTNGEMQYKVGDKGTYSTTIPTGTNADDYTVYYKVVGTSNQFDDSEEGSIIVKIAKAKLTVTAEDKSVTYGDEAPEYSAKYEGFVNNEKPEVLGGKLAFTCGYKQGSDVGTYPITPSGLTADNYDITFKAGTLTVEKGDITVTAPKAVEKLVYSGKPQALITEGSTDAGEIQYSLDGKNYSKAVPTGTDAKEYTVYYTVVADGNFNAVEAKTVSATIAKARLTVTAQDEMITYGDQAPEYSVAYEGFVNKETASVLGGKLAFTCGYKQGSDVGTYPITPSGLTSDNYEITFKDGTLTVEKGDITVTAPKAVEKLVYSGKPQALITEGSTDAGEIQYSLDGKNYDKAVPTGTDAKEYTVYYTVVADGNHNAVEAKTVSATIAKAALTVTAEDKSVTYGDEAPEYSVKYEGFVNNEKPDVLVGKLAFTCDYKKGSNAGTYPITPSGLTSDNYEITFAKGTLTVEKGDITVTAPKAIEKLVYSGKAQALITEGSTDAGEIQYSLDGKTYDKAIPTGTDAKTYTVYYTVVADGNHNAVEAKTVSATIAKARLFVKANDMTITQGAEAPEYTVTYDGFVNDESASVLGGELAFNCEYRQGADAGTYTIMPEGLTSSNYDIVYDKGTLTVEKKEEPAKENNTGIAFTSADVKAVIGEAIALPKLQNPYNLPVEWLSSNINVATVDQEGMVTIVGPGVAEIWAVFKGNNFFESVSAMYLLTVIQKMDTGIAFPVSEIKAVLGESFQAPELQNPYGLTVEYLSSNPDVATVDQNGVVTLTGAGFAEIWAIFKGNDNYIAAAAMYLMNVLERSDGPGSDDPSDDPPTAINSVTTADDSNDRWYSLNGQKIDKPTKKGVYIRNGEKVVIK